jgi:hypothetical protein
MTMADTIAVMNAGVIEQMGRLRPSSTNARHDVRRNFPRPVQPREGRGGRARRRGRRLDATAASSARHGPAPSERNVWWGSAREGLLARRARARAAVKPARGGRSPTQLHRVSTQYLVRCRGPGADVFEQNTGARDRSVGDRSTCTDAGTRSCSTRQDAHAGSTSRRCGRCRRASRPQGGRGAVGHAARRSRRRPAVPATCSSAGWLWLRCFFVSVVTARGQPLRPNGSLRPATDDLVTPNYGMR